MSRLEKKFSALAAENRAGLVAYVMGGDPDLKTSLDIVKGLPAAGADIIEIGFPFTDPMADGPVIQEAALRSLAAGTTLAKTLGLVEAFRDRDDETPVVLMGYYNPIYAYGREAFLKDARAAGVDGLIVVDLPPEEDDELAAPAGAAGLDFIRLATPTTDAARLPQVVKNASGFIYYVSVAGVTGAAAGEAGTIAEAVSGLKAAGRLPVAVGFGVKTPEKAAEIARLADGVVVGSALVARIAENLDGDRSTGAECVNAVLKFARELGEAVRVARTDVSRV